MAYRALHDLGEPMPAIGPISAAMAAASHQFNKSQDRIRRRFGARGRDTAAQGLLASSGLGSGSAPRAQVVRGIVRSFRSSENVKKKDPRIGMRYQSSLPEYVGGQLVLSSNSTSDEFKVATSALGTSQASPMVLHSGRAGSASKGLTFVPVIKGTEVGIRTGGNSSLSASDDSDSLLMAPRDVAPDLSEDVLEDVSDDEGDGDKRPRGGELVWDPTAAARAGLITESTDDCLRLVDFVESY